MDEKTAYMRYVAAKAGITSSENLHLMGPVKFRKTNFSHFGKGRAFASAVLERPAGNVTHEVLSEVARALEFPPSLDDQEPNFLELLTSHGVTDRDSLLAMGPVRFTKCNFGSLGKGRSAAGYALGRPVPSVTIEILKRIADKYNL